METNNELTLQSLQNQELIKERMEIFQTLSSIPELYTTLAEKAQKGCLALSKIQVIESDEQDEQANLFLVKTRKTLKGYQDANGNEVPGMESMRMGVTKGLDAIKGELMKPEKLLIAEGERVKKLRDSWANLKLQKQQEEQARIQKQKAIDDEIARIKAALKQRVVDGTFLAIQNMNNSIRAYFNEITLDNWDEKVKKFNLKPRLKESVYNDFFAIAYNHEILDVNVFYAIVAEVKKEFPYEQVNTDYVQSAEGTVKMWKEDLPKKREELEKLAALEKENAVQAELLKQELREKQEREQKEAEEKLAKEREQQQKEIQAQLDEEKLQNEFKAQIQSQSGPEIKNVRKERVAILSCPDTDVVKVISKVLYACFTNPKFEGLYKTKRGKVVGLDEAGHPVYSDWLAPLLEFVAKHHAGEIEGITFKEKVSTISKA